MRAERRVVFGPDGIFLPSGTKTRASGVRPIIGDSGARPDARSPVKPGMTESAGVVYDRYWNSMIVRRAAGATKRTRKE